MITCLKSDMLLSENITKHFREEPVIKDISIKVDDGEVVCLLGVSGVGKTTFFNILAGLDTPESGKIFLDGADVTGQTGHMSYMLQKDLLLPHKTVLDNAALPLIIKGKRKKEAREEALSYFKDFGLEGCERLYPDALSGGMRQRAALLRTCLFGGNPVLLDEPFSALDAVTRLGMRQWYLDIAADMGFSTLLITHDIDEAILLGNRIYIMSGIPGKITCELAVEGDKSDLGAYSLTDGFREYKKALLKEIGFFLA